MKRNSFLALLFILLVACKTAAPSNETPQTAIQIPKPILTPTQSTQPPTITPTANYAQYEIEKGMEEIAYSFPMIASSTSAIPLWEKVMHHIFGIESHWAINYNSIYLANNLDMSDLGEFNQFYYDHVVATGTHNAYLSLINNQAEIILVARKPSEDELNLAQEMEIELDVRPVALDAFVFMVNRQNPIDDLTTDQIRAIYSGELTNWQELGWTDNPINAYQRNENSGSQELMNDFVMQGTPMIDSPDMILDSMGGPFTAIGAEPNLNHSGDVYGIGYTVHFYAKYMVSNDNIEFIGINGIEPTTLTISDRSYPFTSEVYVVIRSDEGEDSTATLLRDWLLSEAGQMVVFSSGYIPIGEYR